MYNLKKFLPTAFCTTLISAIFLLSFSSEGVAQQAKSDYEIQKTFKQEYQRLSNGLQEADSSAAIQQLIEDVKELEKNYSEHQELLNVALYPETYEEEMEFLKRRVLRAERQLTTIEEQEQQLQELSGQITSYDSRMDDLSQRTDSLQNAIRKSLQSEEQLAGMVRRYRESLEQRDDLILSFVDSVMITYQQLNVESMQDLENVKKKARFNADGNALKMIQDIANENISLLESNPNLSTDEYLRMSSVNQEFRNMWDKIGTKLVDIYADGNQEAEENISNAIQSWDEKLNSQTWAAIDSAFKQADIPVDSFTDSDSFFSSLNSYLEQSIEASKSENGESTYSDYQNFSNFWTERVQVEWTPHIIDAGILSSRQMATIDQQVKQWASNAEPESRLLVYLLGVSVLAIVALGVILAREKRNKKEEA